MTIDSPIIDPVSPSPALTHEQLIALAIDIADAASRSSIESYTVGVRIGTVIWWDTRLISPDDPELRPAIDQALRYLDARRLIERSSVARHRVCFPSELWEART